MSYREGRGRVHSSLPLSTNAAVLWQMEHSRETAPWLQASVAFLNNKTGAGPTPYSCSVRRRDTVHFATCRNRGTGTESCLCEGH
jgi:hypothetical protein